MRKDNIFIIAVAVWQGVTAFAHMIFPPDNLLVASLGVFNALFPNHLLGGFVMLIATIMATIYIVTNPKRRVAKVALLLPQQFFLMLTALSSANSVITQQYADGVVRGWPFIFLDQFAIFLIASLYTITLPSLLKEDET